MKIPSVEYDNAVRRCAYLGNKLSEYAAACRQSNTKGYVDALFEQIDQVQKAFNLIIQAESEHHRTRNVDLWNSCPKGR